MMKLTTLNTKKIKSVLYLSLLFSIIKILKCNNEDSKVGRIIIKDGLYLAAEYNILNTNKNNLLIDQKSKICSVDNREEFELNCFAYNKIYYDKWVKLNYSITLPFFFHYIFLISVCSLSDFI